MMRQQRQSLMTVYVCLVVLVTVDSVATAFVPLAVTFHCHRPKGHAAKSMTSTRIYSTSKESSTDISAENMFPDATILEFTLEEHKPLGCTVEESLAHPMEKHVFITKVCVFVCFYVLLLLLLVYIILTLFPCDCSLRKVVMQKQPDSKWEMFWYLFLEFLVMRH